MFGSGGCGICWSIVAARRSVTVEEEAVVAVAVIEEVDGELDADTEGGRAGTLGMGSVGGGTVGGIMAADERRRTESEE